MNLLRAVVLVTFCLIASVEARQTCYRNGKAVECAKKKQQTQSIASNKASPSPVAQTVAKKDEKPVVQEVKKNLPATHGVKSKCFRNGKQVDCATKKSAEPKQAVQSKPNPKSAVQAKLHPPPAVQTSTPRPMALQSVEDSEDKPEESIVKKVDNPQKEALAKAKTRRRTCYRQGQKVDCETGKVIDSVVPNKSSANPIAKKQSPKPTAVQDLKQSKIPATDDSDVIAVDVVVESSAEAQVADAVMEDFVEALEDSYSDQEPSVKKEDLANKLHVETKSSAPVSPNSKDPSKKLSVSEWLQSIGLGGYGEGFVLAGFDDLELLSVLTEMEREDMFQLVNLKLGHKFKLRRALDSLSHHLTHDEDSLYADA